MNAIQNSNADTFLLLTILVLVTVVLIVAIRAFSASRVAREQSGGKETTASLQRIEQQLAQVRGKVDAMETMMRDV